MDQGQIDQEALNIAKKMGRSLGRWLIKILKPFLPIIIIAFVIFMFIAMLIGGVYSAFPDISNKNTKTPILAGVHENLTEDQKLQQTYQRLVDKYNLKDAWVINSVPVSPEDGDAYESSPRDTFYPGNGVSNINSLADKYGHDQELRLRWGQVHAATLYETYTLGINAITEQLQDQVANGLHPYFYYKMSYVITTTQDEDGNSETHKTPVPLLVEAYTIKGHYQYHYHWVTKTMGSGEDAYTITQEEFKDSQQILPNKWQRLEDWIQKEYKLSKDDEDLALARSAIWEAGVGYDEGKEWLDWLEYNGLLGTFLSGASIPGELIPLFKEAEEKYGIPWWFLAAVALKESSFNPQAENTDSGCYGLMQVSPGNWPAYARRLGFDPVLDRDNPRAQILVGAYMLSELGFKNINWQGDWQEQTLPVLTSYGGYVSVPPGKPYSSPQEWCRAEYASIIWNYALEFKQNSSRWPVPGYQTIKSYFGDTSGRDHVHKGIDIAAPMGATVVSASSGIVTFAGWENPANHEQGYGQYVCVRDQTHLYFYGHLSKIGVRVGQTVNVGDQIGLVGRTGDSTGPHLHFEVRVLAAGGSSGQAIDPLTILNQN